MLDFNVSYLLKRDDILPRALMEQNAIHLLKVKHPLIEVRRHQETANGWLVNRAVRVRRAQLPRAAAGLRNTQVLQHYIALWIKVHISSIIFFGLCLVLGRLIVRVGGL